MKRLLVLLCCFFYGIQLITAQTCMPLNSQGPIPRQLVGTAEDACNFYMDESRRKNDIVTQNMIFFLQQTRPYYSALVASGQISFGDSVSLFANRILDRLLKDDLMLRSKLVVCIKHDNMPNAYTLDNGVILITTSLIARFENEAQLAFVLAHEVIHYKKDHLYNNYIISSQLLGHIRDESVFIDKASAFSQEQELEADRKGVVLYLRAGYALSEAYTAVGLIDDDIDRQAQKKFTPSFFNSGDYIFPSGYLLIDDGEFDEKLHTNLIITHPDSASRIEAIQKVIEQTHFAENTNVFYQLSESWYHAIRQQCKMIVVNQYLEERQYTEALYYAYNMTLEDSTTLFPQKIIAKALYGMVAYEDVHFNDSYPSIVVSFVRPEHQRIGDFLKPETPDFYKAPVYSSARGQLRATNYFFTILPEIELSILALNWNWRLHQRYPNDQEIDSYCDSLIKQLVLDHGVSIDYFYSLSHYDFIAKYGEDSLKKVASDEFLLVPYSKLSNEKERVVDSKAVKSIFSNKKEEQAFNLKGNVLAINKLSSFKDIIDADGQQRKSSVDSLYYFRFAFQNVINDNAFRSRFAKYAGFSKRAQETQDSYENHLFLKSLPRYGLGIDSLVVITPSFYKIRLNQSTDAQDVLLWNSSISQTQQIAAITNAAKGKKIGIRFLTPVVMDSSNVFDYNTYCMLQHWLTERSLHRFNPMMKNIATVDPDVLIKRLGCRYVMSTVMYSRFFESRTGPPGVKMESAIIDVKTGEILFYYQKSSSGNGSKSQMAGLYSTFFKVVKMSSANPN